MPKNDNQLDALKLQHGVDKVYSWSKISCFLEDKWTYFLKYVLHTKEDKPENIYLSLGTAVHSQMENFYLKNLSNAEMVENFKTSYDLARNMYGKNFVYIGDNLDEEARKKAEETNEKLARKFVMCCSHFLANVKKEEGMCECEKFYPCVITDANGKNYLIQCYIDFANWKSDGSVDIIDYKTSTFYDPKKAEKLKRQLEFYGVALSQNEGISCDKIHLAWNFIKYINVKYIQKNGKEKERRLERNDIGGHFDNEGKLTGGLQAVVKSMLKELGYTEDDAYEILVEFATTNSMSVLPQEIQDRFTFSNCILPIEFNEQEASLLEGFIIDTIKEIEMREEEYERTKDESLWWQDVSYEDVYRLENLSGYSPKLHKPYQEYLAKVKAREEEGQENPEIVGGSAFSKLWGSKTSE